MKKICICFRGELLRNERSTYNHNEKSKKLLPCSFSDEAIKRQNTIMESIINHIITPYESKGYTVFVSGCVYECPKYSEYLNKYFPNNTIKQIKGGQTNQPHMSLLSVENGEQEHPGCVSYISIRGDYLMLRDVKIDETKETNVGTAWKNDKMNPVDVFFIIPKDAVTMFKGILQPFIKLQYKDTHFVPTKLNNKYYIWDDYSNQATGISYGEYCNEIHLHKNRPFVNYMRYM